MSWSNYHLETPLLCTPLPVMSGLVSAACERREALDSEFHASCASSGAHAVAESVLTDLLLCDSACEVPFREIRKESRFNAPYGNGAGSSSFSFMHMFDAFLRETLEGNGQTMGYGQRTFADSAGSRSYGSLEDLASALSESLIAPHTIAGSAATADEDFQVALNAAWASQRTRMLRLLRYVVVESGGFAMRNADAEGNWYGGTPQGAYDAIASRTISETEFLGWETPLECRVECHFNEWDVPEERWTIDSASEIVRISPLFDGCLETSAGLLRFDAAAPDEEGANGSGSDACAFDPLCTTVSSGANAFALSGGIFASWGCGSASSIGGPETAPGRCARGWQARNVKVIYDYESTFNFKQGE